MPTRPGQMQCQALVNTRIRVRAAADSVPGPSPAQLQSVYGVTAAASSGGSGTTVAIVDPYDDPNAASDLVNYRSAAGLPACASSSGTGPGTGCLTQVNQSGASSLPGTDPTGGWEAEESLDLDMVSAFCPNCHLLLVEANSPAISDLATAENTAVALGATVVSNSWGSGSEFIGERSFDSAFNHPGVAITAAAGDTGYGVQYPAASPYVTSVGGTSLYYITPPTNAWIQAAWSGTGSGCSVLEPAPAWQQAAGSRFRGCLNRTGNDVSAAADPNSSVAVWDTFPATGLNVGWNFLAGTSEATAMIAGIYAIAGTPAPGTYPASYLYQQPSTLYDITTGSANGTCETSRAYLCNPEAGYDGPSGWGTPDGTAPFAESLSGNVVSLEDPGTVDYQSGTPVNLQIAGHDSGGQALTYSAGGLPTGLSISSTGLISGTATAAGAATVTVTAADASSARGSVSFTIVTVPSLAAAFHSVAGPVRFGVAGRCLDDRNGSTANGNPIQIYTCDGKTRQAWTYLPGGNPGGAGTLRVSGKCLDVTGTGNGATGVLWTCDGSAGEQWALAGLGQLVSPAAGRCLSGPASGANGTQVSIADCTGQASQSWTPPASPVPSGVAGKCMDDRNNATSNGNPIQSAACTTSSRQKWTVMPDGTVRIHGKCLDVSGLSSLDGAAIDLYTCSSARLASQQWLTGPGGELINARSGRCLAIPGDSTANGTALKQEDCYGNAGEIWALT
ncbi:MAG TPA: ricin-type beta-trefoil lectin domain protein [Streptosporangiaceae bacterium]